MLASGFFKVGDYFRFKAIAESLANEGHSISILTGDLRKRLSVERERINGVEWIYPPYIGGVALSERLTEYLPETKIPYDILYRIYFMLRHSSNYDVIHGFHIGFNTYLPFVTARISRHSALVFDWCDLWNGGIIRPPEAGSLKKLDFRCSVALEPLSTRYADGVTVNNMYLAAKAESFGISRDRILVLQDGAYSKEIQPIDKGAARQRLGINNALFMLGFSGFFHPDTEMVIEALAEIRRSTNQDIKLLFIGSINSSLLELIEKRDLKDAVIYVGPVEHEKIGEYLSACDLLLLPFTDRPVNLGRWPQKLGDYLSSGRPVVAGGFGDVKEFFSLHPDIGITCDGTAKSFSEAIIAMKNDPLRIERAGRAARKVAEENMSWEKKTKVLEGFYYGLLEQNKNKANFSR